MEQERPDLLPENILFENTIPGNKLIPLWIKIFSWLFLATGIVAPVGIIFGLLGYEFKLSLYGLETNQPLSVNGFTVIILFILKGITAFGILTKKDWEIKLSLPDAITGILFCTITMIFIHFMIRLELLALIPFLLKMIKIKMNWEIEITKIR